MRLIVACVCVCFLIVFEATCNSKNLSFQIIFFSIRHFMIVIFFSILSTRNENSTIIITKCTSKEDKSEKNGFGVYVEWTWIKRMAKFFYIQMNYSFSYLADSFYFRALLIRVCSTHVSNHQISSLHRFAFVIS